MTRGSPEGPTFSIYLLPKGVSRKAARHGKLKGKPARVYRRPADVTRFVQDRLLRPAQHRQVIAICVSEVASGYQTRHFGTEWLQKGLGPQYAADMVRAAQHRFYLRNRVGGMKS